MNPHSLKILVFMPDNGGPDIDGTTADAINIAKSFAVAKTPSIFVFNGHPEIFRRFEETSVDVRRMEMPISGVKQHFNPLYRRRFSRVLSNFLETENIDVIHLGQGAPYILNYLKKSKVLKVCVQQGATPDFKPTELFNNGVSLSPVALIKAWYRKYVRLNYKRADLVVCVGEAAHTASIRTFHIKPERAAIVRPGITSQRQNSAPGTIRREFEIGDDEKIVLSVGRITEAKGVEDFGKIARELTSRGEKFRFFFAGRERDTSYGNMIKQKYGDAVTFIGHRPDIFNAYADADLLVHFSHREGSPLVVIEALEYGLPCVAWDVPGVSEDVEDEVTGRTVPFGDHGSAADAIQQILNSPVDLEKFGAGARHRFTRFSIDNYSARLLEAYKARRREIAST